MLNSLSSCAENARRISRKMDVPLPLGARLALLIHLAGCRSCRRYSRQIRSLRLVLVESSQRSDLLEAERLPIERRARIKQLLRADGRD